MSLLYLDEVIDSIEYGTSTVPAPEKDQSIGRNQDGLWQITEIPSPNATNIFLASHQQYENSSATESTTEKTHSSEESGALSDDQQTDEGSGNNVSKDETIHYIIDIAEPAEELDADSFHTSENDTAQETLTGMVTAVPGTFGKQIAFIEGRQLYNYWGDWPELQVGDVIRVEGESTESRGESRLKTQSADDISVQSSVSPTSTPVSIEELASYPIGSLVTVSGWVTQYDDDKLTFEDDSGILTIVAHSATGISWRDLVSDQMHITGIIRYLNDELRLYPRSMDDIEYQTTDESDESYMDSSTVIGGISNDGDDSVRSYAMYAIGGAGLAMIIFFLRNQFSTTSTV